MIIISKIVNFFKKNYVFFGVLFLLPLYHFLVINSGVWFQVTESTYAYHATDYSFGFCSRLLVGELYHILVGIYDKNAVNVYLTVLYFLFIVLLALLVNIFVKGFKKNKKACIVLIMFFLTGPFTFSMFVTQFGLLEFYCAFIFFFGIIFLHNKYLKYLIPLLVAMLVMINYSTLISYVIVLLLITLFVFARQDNKKAKGRYLAIFIVSVIIGVGITLYFILNDASNLLYSREEFSSILSMQRNANPSYYEFYLYSYFSPQLPVYDYAVENGWVNQNIYSIRIIFKLIIYQVEQAWSVPKKQFLLLFDVLTIVFQVLFIRLLKSYYKQVQQSIKKLLIIGIVIFSLVLEIVSILRSMDNSRWLSTYVISIFSLALYILYYEFPEGMEKINSYFSKIGYGLTYVILFFYANIRILSV